MPELPTREPAALRLRRVEVPPVAAVLDALPQGGAHDPVVRARVQQVIAEVAQRGDVAVQAFTREFDGIDLAPSHWEMPLADAQAALARLDPALRAALELAVARVRTYHERQREQEFTLDAGLGAELRQRITPLERVGLYVPGGTASYPSSVIMNAVPAAVAGVREIIAVTPPRGHLTDAVLAACALAGVTRIFRLGGAQAIAALAYGTATVPRVAKIVGPGNKYVAEAKRQVVGDVGIDMVAGPTEVLVLADASAPVAHVAADLIAQAEHDEDAVAWLVTTSRQLADAIDAALEAALASAPRAAIARRALARHGVVVHCRTMAEAQEVANLRAPEHLQVLCADPDAVAAGLHNAGAIFLGDATPEPVGDYLAGPSHVLPTSGTARFASPLGWHDFVKRTSLVRWTAARLAADAPHIVALAEAEGLPGHAEAVRIRCR